MKYYVLKCMLESKDFSEESYGVLLSNDDCSKDYFCDISDNMDFITKLVEKLNNHHIESCHFSSVLEDFKFTSSAEENL